MNVRKKTSVRGANRAVRFFVCPKTTAHSTWRLVPTYIIHLVFHHTISTSVRKITQSAAAFAAEVEGGNGWSAVTPPHPSLSSLMSAYAAMKIGSGGRRIGTYSYTYARCTCLKQPFQSGKWEEEWSGRWNVMWKKRVIRLSWEDR